MQSFAGDCIKEFCDLTGYGENKIKPAPTPFIDESKESSGVIDEEEGMVGELSSISAKCLMKVMYMARLARGDLLRAIGHLNTKITKWTKDCDATLLRVMSYLMSSSRQIGFIGDELRTCSCATTHRCRLCRRPKRPQIDFWRLFGISRHSQLWPLCGQSKKQTAVSHSTVEAELVACNHGLRSEGLPHSYCGNQFLVGRPVLCCARTIKQQCELSKQERLLGLDIFDAYTKYA